MILPHLATRALESSTGLANNLQQYLGDKSMAWSAVGNAPLEEWGQWLLDHWASFIEWLSQPHVLAVIMAFWITFTVVVTIAMIVGFSPIGIVAGSLAAAFQSYMYGGFTPAGGIFATLTSMAMLGTLMFPLFAVAVVIATAVAVIVWACGVGR
ncbi:hypothetical protein PRK78_001833 [Emydomyces testavorans]|uniref:Transmembrane protein n=1 Tax=Emydomyces testavorans TaxID=2070801 RepID=A0AAF0DEM4_9EURO|nr:hypothetical protein PRK78_001833 [Emydomyces testavorans]